MQLPPDLPPTYHEVIYNTGYGGYSFSQEALDEYCKRKNIEFKNIPCRDEALRDHPIMIDVLKTLGKCANGLCAKLSIKRIQKRLAKAWSISEYE